MHQLPSADAVIYSEGDHDAGGAHARQVRARKRVHAVDVRFTEDACAVETLEGVVRARPGDAIVTGMFGECWPVPRSGFADRYQALAPLEMGAPGRYLSLPVEVEATRMTGRFEVVLADGDCRLQGRSGDWLVDYGDGSLGIVSADIFAATYELLEAG